MAINSTLLRMSITELGEAARAASRILASATRADKDAALVAMADALASSELDVLAANKLDIKAACKAGTPAALIDRLSLDSSRLAGMVAGIRQLASLADPVGEVVRGWTLANGVSVRQVRVPFGVIAIIYEARPNVTADAAGICLKSGSASLLRGSSSALNSNRAIVSSLRRGLVKAGLPEASVSLVEGGHEATDELMQARGLVDVLIPRGGANLISAVVDKAKVPVIETGTGNCHLFVDESADFQMAQTIIINAKTQRPSVCNALETLLIHEDIAKDFLPKITDTLIGLGVTLHGDERSRRIDDRIIAAKEADFVSEFLSLDLAVKIVADLDEAIEHIQKYSTGHSETIVTSCVASADKFVASIDAAAVLVNASSRFVDGGEFGFGAEIGISTQKLHARGPMALAEMTSTKYVVTGQGQVRK